MEEVVVDTRDVSFRFYGKKCFFMIESLFTRWNYQLEIFTVIWLVCPLFQAKQLDLMLEYIEVKEEAEKNGKSANGIAEGKGGKSIPQYQVGMSNASNASYSTRPDSFSPLMNAPNLLKLSNTNLLTNEQLFQESKSRNFATIIRFNVDYFYL